MSPRHPVEALRAFQTQVDTLQCEEDLEGHVAATRSQSLNCMIGYFILGLCCLVGLCSPVYGIGLLLILEASIFNLGYHFATVPLPIGYAGPMDLLLMAILIGAVCNTTKRHNSVAPAGSQGKYGGIASAHSNNSRRSLCSAIVPYVVWLGACGLMAMASGDDIAGSRLAIRSAASYILPWVLAVAVWRMRHRSWTIVKMLIAISVGTAIIHLVIQLLDLRSVMMYAYYAGFGSDPSVLVYRKQLIAQAEVVRGLPQGTQLMLYTGVFCFAVFLATASRRRRLFLACFVLLLSAFAVTLTRSLVALSLAGCFCAMGIQMLLGIKSSRIDGRITAAVLSVGILGMLLNATPYGRLWTERLHDFRKDRQIFSDKTNRGADNLAAIEAIKEQPVRGYGMGLYPDRFSKSPTAKGNDTHPMLAVGLFGGVAAILLALRLHLVLLSRTWLLCRIDKGLARRMLPYLSVFASSILVNAAGAGGSLHGRGLIPVAIYAGLMAAEISDPTPPIRADDGKWAFRSLDGLPDVASGRHDSGAPVVV